MPTQANTLNAALLKAQSEFPPIPKDTEGQARGGRYRYATLPGILEKVLPILHRHGILLTQPVRHLGDGYSLVVTTLTLAETGEQLASEVPLPVPTNYQEWGSAVTYARRYSLTAMLGIAPDDDDDGGTAQGHTQGAPARNGNAPATRKPAPHDERDDAMAALDALYGNDVDAKLAYVGDVLGREIAAAKDVKYAEWSRVKAAAVDDLAAQNAGGEQGALT